MEIVEKKVKLVRFETDNGGVTYINPENVCNIVQRWIRGTGFIDESKVFFMNGYVYVKGTPGDVARKLME